MKKNKTFDHDNLVHQRGFGFSKVGDLLNKFQSDEDKYISREFQKYGYELAKELGDLKNKSLYIKLAKESSRGLLESARSFVKDAYEVKSKPRLYMWKLTQLKKEQENKNKEKIK
jgi:hypothetical protein